VRQYLRGTRPKMPCVNSYRERAIQRARCRARSERDAKLRMIVILRNSPIFKARTHKSAFWKRGSVQPVRTLSFYFLQSVFWLSSSGSRHQTRKGLTAPRLINHPWRLRFE
jgi:hypothetical protein